MLGTFHIIHENARFATKRVRCYGTGRYHRHKTHLEESVSAACGKILVSGRNQFCSILVANPYWNHNWCHDCVKVFSWTDDARNAWLEKGIETLDTDQEDWPLP